MEVFYYRCGVCGYVHQVPGYWMGYEPEPVCEQMHLSPDTREVCENQTLTYAGGEDED